MSRSLRILLLGDGGSFHIDRCLSELRAQGQIVELCSLEPGPAVDRLLDRKGVLKQLHYTLACPQLLSIINEFNPDVIFAHYATGYGHLASKLTEKSIIPYLLSLWGSDILLVPHKSPLHRKKAELALSRAAHVIADSEYLLEAAAKISEFRTGSVIPWGVESKYLNLYDESKTLSDPLKVIVPRAHEAVYENLFIVETLAELVASGAIELTFPSFGSLYESFKQRADAVTLGRVRYYDKMPRAAFLSFFSQQDVALSNSSSDSSPVSLIEAMGFGLIPVARKIPGVLEWLTPENGYLYESGDSNALRNIIERISSGEDADIARRKVNRDRVLSQARFEQNIAQQIDIMRAVLAGGTR
ncbi:MAG: glycosyltransferase [bacterium]|nr:glycosyltransferase [bacterium]